MSVACAQQGLLTSIGSEVHAAISQHVDPASTLHSDGVLFYKSAVDVAKRESVDHNKEFVRETKDGEKVHTNTAEGYFSIFKRGPVGTYQHMSEQHLARYLAEFDFRMNNRVALGIDDAARADLALQGIVGKRLAYRRTNEAADA